ncbi:MAG: D-alanyl-D-alanine carboxypeptidase, partial [Paracoccaceae bacterium]
LAEMAVALKAAGLREVAGRFWVHGGALPRISRIDPGEPDYLAYNAAVSGLNLNYNRVYFEWKREGADYSWTMDARSDNFRPAVKLAQMSIVDRASPVFDYSLVAGGENWTVARAALGERGARWLPVRQPELYAGEVLQIMARAQGIRLTSPTLVTARPRGRVLVERKSAPLADILLGMLKNSNNLTAEITGLSASLARGAVLNGLAASGDEMARWMGTRLGARRARFVDHSGLGQDNSLSARDMVSALLRIGPDSTLASMLARVSLRKKLGEIDAGRPAQVWAKTGTLDFVSALAGFVVPQNGRRLAFAVFSADLERRSATSEAERACSRGAKSWEARARELQR